MSDQRSQARRNTPHRINVLSADDDRVLGRLVNITTGGLMFLTGRDHAVDARLAMRLPLPTRSHERTSIDVAGTVAWRMPDANPQFVRIGVQFDNLGAEEGYIIETVLQRLHLVG